MQRRSFLAGLAPALWLPSQARAAAPLAARSVWPGRRLRPAPGPFGRAVDAPDGGRSGRPPRRRDRRRLDGRRGRADAEGRAFGRGRRRAALGPFGACRCRGAEAQPALLVSLHRAGHGEPAWPHAHRARRDRARGGGSLLLRLLPAVRAGLLLRPAPHGRGGAERGPVPGRLYLRDLVGPRSRAPSRGGASDDARGISQPLRALQIRPRSAGLSRRTSLDRDVGRPRGRERLRQRRLANGPRSHAVPGDPRRGLPGLLGAHAALQRSQAGGTLASSSTTAIASAISPRSPRSTTGSIARATPAIRRARPTAIWSIAPTGSIRPTPCWAPSRKPGSPTE